MEPVQNKLFFDCIEDAIGKDIEALGGAKKAAAIFYPDKTPEQGSALIRAWKNPDRNERPTPTQVLLLKKKAKEVGSFATISYEAQEIGFSFELIDPEDEAALIERENNQLFKEILRRQDRLERLRSTPSPVRSVK
jgi:hypothetical protein